MTSVARPPRDRSRLRVGFSTGALAQHDAISESLATKVDAVRGMRALGFPIDIDVFTHGCDEDLEQRLGVPVHTGPLSQILSRSPFVYQDVHVFEFGIYYPLFDAAFAVPFPSAAIGVFHNITPIDLVDGQAQRAAVQNARRQMMNLAHVGTVVCDSQFNRHDLLSHGIEPLRCPVIHLPGRASTWNTTPHDRVPAAGPRCHLVFVGRFVRAKGVYDLLSALASLNRPDDVVMTFVGDPKYSDPACLCAIELASHETHGVEIELLTSHEDTALDALLATADAVVLPTYHEGLGLPVIEAFRCGCPVIGYDAANMPSVTGALASLVPTGDVHTLTTTLNEFVASTVAHASNRQAQPVPTDCGLLDRTTWVDAVYRHLEAYSPDGYATRVQREIMIAAGRLERPPAWIQEARVALEEASF